MLPTGPLRSGGEVVDGSDDRPEASSAIVAQDLDTMDPRGRGDSESLTTSSACTVCSVSLTVGGTLQVAIAYLVSIREVRLWDRPSGEIGVSCSHTGIQDEDADPSTLVAAAATSANTVQAPTGAVLVGIELWGHVQHLVGLGHQRQHGPGPNWGCPGWHRALGSCTASGWARQPAPTRSRPQLGLSWLASSSGVMYSIWLGSANSTAPWEASMTAASSVSVPRMSKNGTLLPDLLQPFLYAEQILPIMSSLPGFMKTIHSASCVSSRALTA